MSDMSEEGVRSEPASEENIPEVEMDTNTIPPPEGRDVAVSKEDAEAEVISVSTGRRWLWWVLGVIGILLILSTVAWKMGWLHRAYAHFNRAQVGLKVQEGTTFVIQGATVTLDGATYTTDSNGKIEVTTLLTGTYPVVVRKTGYQELDFYLTVHRGDNGLQSIAMTLLPEKLYSITGYIQDYISGQPILGVTVTTGQDTTTTDASGAFSFTKQPAAAYTLNVSKSGYITKQVPITITNADSVTASLPLVPAGSVVFTSNQSGKRGIFTVNYDGTNREQLAASTGEEFGQQLSPDGSTVAFLSTRDGLKDTYGGTASKLYIATLDGKTVKKVSDSISQGVFNWSPNSRYLYFESYPTPDYSQLDRQVYDLAKGTLFNVGVGTDFSGFSPDGNSIVYVLTNAAANGNPVTYNLVTAVIATGQKTTVINQSPNFLYDTVYSADGKSLTFDEESNSARVYYTLDLTTAGATPQQIPAPTAAAHTYITSPNGKLKVFTDTRDGKTDVFLSTATGDTNLSNLGVVVVDTPLVWDTSGSYVVFGIKREGEQALYVVSVNGGDPHKVTDYYDDSAYSQQ